MKQFNNTEVAFKSKSNQDLNRAYWLFKIIGYPSIVKIGKGFTNFALKTHLPINGIIRSTIFKQFCGGETINECEKVTSELNSFGIGTILDYSVEGKTSAEDFEKTTKEIIATILKAKGNPAIPYAVFKVTGISTFSILEKYNNLNNELSENDKIEFQGIFSRVDRICKAAFVNEVPVFIDAEETWIQDTIDRLTVSMMNKYNKEKAIVFNTLQMYRHDRIVFLQNAIQDAKQNGYHYGIKLVRGAYMEKERERAHQKGYPSPIQATKKDSDNDYNKALEIIIENLDVLALCAGTHNEESSAFLAELIESKGLNKNDKRIYFAQLLGMSDHISYNLSNSNYNVAKYVPYGPICEVLPYLLRRADENTSVAGQTGRELSLLTIEKKRRKE
ncbi:MAG: proline dehydrogenase family protein [Crocinitomicaceae bacterium]|nr:proline dehydrogenase family protein [Crocinitomicaceae bacterium]